MMLLIANCMASKVAHAIPLKLADGIFLMLLSSEIALSLEASSDEYDSVDSDSEDGEVLDTNREQCDEIEETCCNLAAKSLIENFMSCSESGTDYGDSHCERLCCLSEALRTVEDTESCDETLVATPLERPLEYAMAQTAKFDELMTRNGASACTQHYSPGLEPFNWAPQETQASLPTKSDIDDLVLALQDLPKDTKTKLLKILVADLTIVPHSEEKDQSADKVPELQDSVNDVEILLDKLDLFLQLWLRLTFAFTKAAIPHVKSLYYKFRLNRLYFFNQRNLTWIIDSVLAVMQTLDESFSEDSCESPWELLSLQLCWSAKLAQRNLCAQLLGKDDNGYISKLRHAAAGYATQSLYKDRDPLKNYTTRNGRNVNKSTMASSKSGSVDARLSKYNKVKRQEESDPEFSRLIRDILLQISFE